jgi:predicted transcriptional regulator
MIHLIVVGMEQAMLGECRLSGSWMSIWDDRILEVLRLDGPNTPTKLSECDCIHVSQPQVSRRLSKLSENELVNSLGNGVYQITDRGEDYLRGTYDAERRITIEKDGINSDSVSKAEN